MREKNRGGTSIYSNKHSHCLQEEGVAGGGQHKMLHCFMPGADDKLWGCGREIIHGTSIARGTMQVCGGHPLNPARQR